MTEAEHANLIVDQLMGFLASPGSFEEKKLAVEKAIVEKGFSEELEPFISWLETLEEDEKDELELEEEEESEE